MRECCTIQQLNRSQHSQQNSCDRTAKLFAKLMMEAKVRAVLRLVTQANGSGPLPLNNLANPDNPTNTQTVRDILLKNIHPNSHLKKSTIITSDTPSAESHPILFDEVNWERIRNTILRMDGAAGQSGLDAASWKRLCTSLKSASADLCESLATTARRICTCYVDPSGMSAFVACRLIALDKCLGTINANSVNCALILYRGFSQIYLWSGFFYHCTYLLC